MTCFYSIINEIIYESQVCPFNKMILVTKVSFFDDIFMTNRYVSLTFFMIKMHFFLVVLVEFLFKKIKYLVVNDNFY